MFEISLYIMAALYVLAGANHFISPAFYRPLMPPYIPAHNLMIVLSGIAEIVLGAALFFPATRRLAAWGVIALLIAVFPVHIYMFQERETIFSRIPVLLIIARIPLQFVLMWWAWLYT